MTIGTAIFLSSSLISLVFLYVQTKDRWNWKKIFKHPLALFLAGVFVFYSIAGLIDFNNHQSQRPKLINEFEGIKLGDKKDDVIFKLGYPPKKNFSINNITPKQARRELERRKRLTHEQAAAELERRQKIKEKEQNKKEFAPLIENENVNHNYSKKAQDLALELKQSGQWTEEGEKEFGHLLKDVEDKEEYDDLEYDDLIIRIKNNIVYEIIYICSKYSTLNGIWQGDSSQNIVRRFGDDVVQFNNTIHPDMRIYQIKKYNVSYCLRKDKVLAFIVGHGDINETMGQFIRNPG